MPSSWLPLIIENDAAVFEDYDQYLEKIYSIFCSEIRDSGITFMGQKIIIRTSPMTFEKENAFWHLTQESDPTSESKSEEDRMPDLKRMARICWIAPLILSRTGENKDKVLVWISPRPGPKTYLISLLDFSYVVVIEYKKGFCLLKTAYSVGKNRRIKLKKEYDESEKVP